MRTVGPYRLISLVGRGATSEVHVAEHPGLGDRVAIKLLRPELAADPAQTAALLDEGTKLRAIDHPNVVRVLDAGIDPGTDGCYLVMEHVAGEPLSARLRRDAPLPERLVRDLGAQLADGVAAAHARGIVHRDLKPANIMLDGERPKIVDFGIARHLGARSAVSTGRMIGTLAYMAPEQLASGLIAPCTDLWALGIILFEAACGRHPFDNFDDGRCPQLFDAPARAAAINPDVSTALDAILARCLERDPARRIGSAAELARLLRGELALDDERITIDAGPIAPGLARTAAARGDAARLDVPRADLARTDAARGDAARTDLVSDGSPAPAARRSRIALAIALGGATVIAAVAFAAARRRDGEPATVASTIAASPPAASAGTPNGAAPAGTPNAAAPTTAAPTAAPTGTPNAAAPTATPNGTPNAAAPTVAAPAAAPTATPNAAAPTGTPNAAAPTGTPTGTPNAGAPTAAAPAAAPTGTPNAAPPTGTPNAAAPTGTPNAAAPTGTPAAAPTTTATAAGSAARAVEVRSTPAGAQVLVDGEPRGVTPLRLELALPETIVVRRTGYRPARVRVDAAGRVEVTLRRAAARARRTQHKETLD